MERQGFDRLDPQGRDADLLELVRRLEQPIQLADPWLDALCELHAVYAGAADIAEPCAARTSPWRSRVLVAAGLTLALVSLPSVVAAVTATPPHTASAAITAVDPTRAELSVPPRPVLRAVTTPTPLTVAIPAIGVRGRLVALGLEPDGTLATPTDFNAPGWYAGGPAPGGPGAAVIVGHVDSYKGPAVFYKLERLHPGDRVVVARADGSTVTFTVQRLESYPKDRFPTARVYGATATPELRLITCFGSFDAERKSYTRNLVVFARLSSTTPPQRQSPPRAAPTVKELI